MEIPFNCILGLNSVEGCKEHFVKLLQTEEYITSVFDSIPAIEAQWPDTTEQEEQLRAIRSMLNNLKAMLHQEIAEMRPFMDILENPDFRAPYMRLEKMENETI